MNPRPDRPAALRHNPPASAAAFDYRAVADEIVESGDTATAANVLRTAADEIDRYREALEAATTFACTFGPDAESLCPAADPDGWTTWCAPCFARRALGCSDA